MLQTKWIKTLVIEFQALWHLHEFLHKKVVFFTTRYGLWNQRLSRCLTSRKVFREKKIARTKAEKTYGDTYKSNYIRFWLNPSE